jgi:hypothetical protein
MRGWFLLTCGLACAALACRSSSTPSPEPATPTYQIRVDPRVELLAIVQRLAGAPEYRTAPATAYVQAVDAHFGPLADHPAVAATRELRARHGISYDAPMTLAIHLDEAWQLRAPLAERRFSGVELEAYLAALREFARASDFAGFFAKHRAFHDRVATRLRDAIVAEDPASWLTTLFGGRPGARFTVIAAPLCGTWNYGPHLGDDLYQVMGLARLDADELPIVDADMLELVVHEMAHAYVNPLFASHRAALEPAGRRLFAKVEPQMRQQAYATWEIFLNESAVRAVTALYARERKGRPAGEAAIRREVDRGFLWTASLVDELARYAADRVAYRDLAAFLPQLIATLDRLD